MTSLHLAAWRLMAACSVAVSAHCRILPTAEMLLCPVQVVLFNHVSWVDSLVMMRMFAPSGVAKARGALSA